MQHFRRNLCIAGDAGVRKTLVLNIPCGIHTHFDGRGAFLLCGVREVAKIDRRHFNVQVDTVEQWPGNAAEVSRHGGLRAGARACGVTVIAAWAGVHGGDEHKFTRERDRAVHARDGHNAVLKRLAQRLHGAARKLRQLIQKQHAVVCEGDLAGAGDRPAARKPRAGDGMVRRAEGARFNERGVARQKSRNGVNFGRFDHFLKAHLRQNGRQPLCKHAFAGTGRADEQHVVPAACGNL